MKLSKRSWLFTTWKQFYVPVPGPGNMQNGPALRCTKCGKKYFWSEFETIAQHSSPVICPCGGAAWERLPEN